MSLRSVAAPICSGRIAKSHPDYAAASPGFAPRSQLHRSRPIAMPLPKSRLPVRTIDQLVRAVTDALIKRHQRAEWEAVLGNRETGQFINAHILENRIRAERHAAVYEEL